MTERRRKPRKDITVPHIKPYRDRDWLVLHYFKNRESAQEIADRCYCSQNTILNWLHKFDIPVRPIGKQGNAKP